MMATSPPSVSRLSRKCGRVDVSQSYGPLQPLTGIALLLLPFIVHYQMYMNKNSKYVTWR
jgi:succinate dehydrogenase hydrophobic anchor subunit